MPVSDLHRQLAAIALGASERYGFALAGGNALIAHGVVNRFTADVDLFTDEEAGVAAAAEAVEAALTAAGFQAERRDKTGGLADIFPDIGGGLAEWIVTAPTGEQTMLQVAYFFERRRVVLDDCGRAYGTRGIHEHSCIRCPLLRVDPAQRPRLEDIRVDLAMRIAEAECEGWRGEAEALKVSLAAADAKLTQRDVLAARRAAAIELDPPACCDIAARTATLPRSRDHANR